MTAQPGKLTGEVLWPRCLGDKLTLKNEIELYLFRMVWRVTLCLAGGRGRRDIDGQVGAILRVSQEEP